MLQVRSAAFFMKQIAAIDGKPQRNTPMRNHGIV